MRKLVKATATILLAYLVAVPLQAQEKPRADEILRYFPDATYRILNHKDFSRVSREEAYPLYKYMTNKQSQVGGRFAGGFSPLPEGMKDKEVSSITAVMVEYSTKEVTATMNFPGQSNGSAPAGGRGRGGRGGRAARTSGNMEVYKKLREEHPGFSGFVGTWKNNGDGTATGAIHIDEGDRMYVYQYDDVASIVQEALKSGDLAEAGKQIRKRPVYKFEGMTFRRFGSGTIYAITTPANELLCAGKISTLRMMLACADGTRPNMLENPQYVDLIDLVPDLGKSWNVSFPRLENGQRLQGILEWGDYTDEQVEAFLERAKAMPMLRVTSVFIDSEVRMETISVYETEEYAEQSRSLSSMLASRGNRNAGNQEGASAQQEFLDATKERLTETRKDNIVRQTLIYDRDYVKTMVKRQEEMMERWEERREEIETRNKESGSAGKQ